MSDLVPFAHLVGPLAMATGIGFILGLELSAAPARRGAAEKRWVKFAILGSRARTRARAVATSSRHLSSG